MHLLTWSPLCQVKMMVEDEEFDAQGVLKRDSKKMKVGKDKQHSLHLQIPPLQKYLSQRSHVGKHQRDINNFNDLLMYKTSMRKE
jgi:hypothetical protein